MCHALPCLCPVRCRIICGDTGRWHLHEAQKQVQLTQVISRCSEIEDQSVEFRLHCSFHCSSDQNWVVRRSVACLKLDFAACHFYLLCVTCSMSLPKSLRRSYASQEKRIEKMYSRLRCLSPPSSLVFCNRNLGMEQNSEPFVNSQPSKWMVSTRISPSNHGIVFSVLTQLLKSMLQAA